MFGHRPDGKLVRTHDGLYTLMPHVLDKRVDSMNFTEFNVDMQELDDFIHAEQQKTGIVYTYLEILASAVIRTIHLRPDLNRFVVNKRIYQRDGIYFSMAFQKTLKKGIESTETTKKFRFEGYENIEQIHNMIHEGLKESKAEANTTDKLCKTLASIPNWLMNFAVGMIKFLDRFGMLPKSVMDAEPFHTTFFITDMRSLKTPAIYHHVYEFGTTGLFLSTGTEKCEPSFNRDGTVSYKRVMPVKFVSDERFCDGYYFAKSLKMVQRLLHNPNALVCELEPPVKPLTKKELKAKKKEEKKASKLAKDTKEVKETTEEDQE